MVADEHAGNAAPDAPSFSDAERAKARAWFKKAVDCRERREYDYAIECYLTGLGFWPESVEEGHMPLRSLALQRQQVGGKKPGMMESMKRTTVGKDAKRCMLNAEYLLAKDPSNASYLDALLKNANRAGYNQTIKWIAPQVFDSLKKDKKPDKSRFKAFRTALLETAERAEAQGEAALACWVLEQAVASLEYLLLRLPGDEELRIEQRDLSGKLAIARGKYQGAETFQDSLREGEKQKLLHDAERIKQGEQTFEALLTAARREFEAQPTAQPKLNALVELLLRREAGAEENEAIALLTRIYEQTGNYGYKVRADDVRLRQLVRQTRQLAEQARQSRSEEDQQQVRLARQEQLQAELAIYRERAANYPTDLRVKYRLGTALFRAGEFDEAIPMLQAAQNDPRSRFQAQLAMGRAFFEKGSPAQAIEVLKELMDGTDLPEELSKETMYWLGRAFEAAGRIDDARATYGKLLRQDYNYAQGDARKRMETLK